MKNREIKFRLWDNFDFMSNPFTLQDIQSGYIQFASECPVMQYTGLKDKNGKEIYEGDIVINVRDKKYGGARYEIRWNKIGYWGVSKEGDDYGPYTLNLYINDGHTLLEVIGNIYQNPDLL